MQVLRSYFGTGAHWIFASALGAFAGAVLAVKLFPDATTFRNATAPSTGEAVGFALTLGLGYGGLQSLVILRSLRALPASKALVAVFWAVVSALGFVSMILPMYGMPGQWSYLFVVAPYLGFLPMLPGLVVLGAVQKFALDRIFGARTKWIRPTVTGGFLGLVVGSLFAIAAGSAQSFEVVLATIAGTMIGLFQKDAAAVVLRARRGGP